MLEPNFEEADGLGISKYFAIMIIIFVWSTNTPMRPRSDIAPGDGGYFRNSPMGLYAE